LISAVRRRPGRSRTQCSLQIKLAVGLNGYKAHVVAGHGFGNRFGIDKIVLVGLYEWLHRRAA